MLRQGYDNEAPGRTTITPTPKLAVERGISAITVKAAVIDLLVGTQNTTVQAGTMAAAEASWAQTAERLCRRRSRPTDRAAPGCREPLAPNLGTDVMPSVGEVERPLTVAYCRACGHVLTVVPDD